MSTKRILFLCKEEDDLFDIMPLYLNLGTRGYVCTLVLDGTDAEANAMRTLPMQTRTATCEHQLCDVLEAGVDGIVSCSHTGRNRLLGSLSERLTTTPIFIFPDVRKVHFREYIKYLGAERVYLLANDASVPFVGCKQRFTTGLPRYDAVTHQSTSERDKRRKRMRASLSVGTNDFVVLFLGQERETASVLQALSTALRALPARMSDRPIRRVLATWRSQHMTPEDTQLWCDTLSLRSDATPGLRVLDNINADARINQLDAMLAADLVVSSTHGELLTAAALGMKALSYLAPGAGETSYEQEIAGQLERWNFLPVPECIRHLHSYTELRSALNSALPIANIDDTISHTTWKEEQAAKNAPWAQGRNTRNCVHAIEQVLGE